MLKHLLFLPVLLLLLTPLARGEEFLSGANRVVFLGDSITHAGQYVEIFEWWALLAHPEHPLEVLNLGLPSETVSGLSEEGHANGKFPRPDLHERLARVLEKTRPDLIFACYGMNDGIYLPLDDERFARFRAGMEKLHAAAEAAGAKIIHLTPPIYDKPGDKADYAAVLDRYTAWLLEQRSKGWRVIDLHGPMAAALTRQREGNPANPTFTFQKDGVHPNFEGHLVMARALIEGLGGDKLQLLDLEGFGPTYQLVQQRSHLLRDAWLHACGHLRPGMAEGKPLPEAEAAAAKLTQGIATFGKD